jgi:hypothetical protein
MGIFTDWYSRSAFVAGAQSVVTLLDAEPERKTILAQFTGPITMLAGRGVRADAVRALASPETLSEYADHIPPQELSLPDEVSNRDQDRLEWATRSALKHMRKQGTELFLLDFERDDLVILFARNDYSIRLINAAKDVGCDN